MLKLPVDDENSVLQLHAGLVSTRFFVAFDHNVKVRAEVTVSIQTVPVNDDGIHRDFDFGI